MQSSDWIQCNSCFAKPTSGTGFYLSSCMHFADEACYRKSPTTCLTCKKACRFMEMSKSMTPELQMLFDDPTRLTKKLAKSFAQVSQVFDFQRMQIGLASKELQRKVLNSQQEYGQLKRKFATLAGETNRLKAENARLTAQNAALMAKSNSVGGENSRREGGFNFAFGGQKTPVPKTPDRFSFLTGMESTNSTPGNGIFQFQGGSNKTPVGAALATTNNPYRDAWQKSMATNRNAAGQGKSPVDNRTRFAGRTPGSGSNPSGDASGFQGGNRATNGFGAGNPNPGNFGGSGRDGRSNVDYARQLKRF